MRITAHVIDENFRSGTSPKGPWKIFTARLMEKNPDREIPNAKEIIEVQLSDDDLDLKGQLEGNVMMFDLTGFKPGFRGQGVEFRGRIVRESEEKVQPLHSMSSTAAA